MLTWHTTVTRRETIHSDERRHTTTDTSTYYDCPDGCDVSITPSRTVFTCGNATDEATDLLEVYVPEDRILDAIVTFIAYRHTEVKSERGSMYSLEALGRVAGAMGLSYDRPTTPEAEA